MIRIPLLQRVLFREMALITGICLGALLCLILLGRLLQLRDLFLAQSVTESNHAGSNRGQARRTPTTASSAPATTTCSVPDISSFYCLILSIIY